MDRAGGLRWYSEQLKQLMRGWAADAADLVLPRDCVGCAAPIEGQRGAFTQVCGSCLLELRRPPERVSARIPIGCPTFAFAPYGGAHRRVVLGGKEHLRDDAALVAGSMFAAGVEHLQARGELPWVGQWLAVPAPSRRASARARGGDHVRAMCAHAACIEPLWQVVPLLSHADDVRDSVGLGVQARQENLSGKVQLDAVVVERHREVIRQRGSHVVLFDDVITTGATLAESLKVLQSAGFTVDAAVVICVA